MSESSPTTFLTTTSGASHDKARWQPGLSPQAIMRGRTARGDTRTAFGQRLGVNDEAVRRWEMGICVPRAEMQTRIAGLISRPARGDLLDRVVSTESKTGGGRRTGAKKSRSGRAAAARGASDSPSSPGGRPQPRVQLPDRRSAGSGKLSSADWCAAVEATGVIVSAYIKEAMNGDSTVEQVANISRTVLDRLVGAR